MRYYTLLYGTVLAVLCLLTWACVDEVRLEAPDQPESGLLVKGQLIAGNPAKASLYIAELYQYNRNLPKPIGGAKVSLENDQSQSLPFIASGDGNYFLDIPSGNPSMSVQPGYKYRIKVNMPNGTQYLSAWETLLNGPKIDNLDFKVADKEVLGSDGKLAMLPHVYLNLNTRLVDTKGNRVHLLWEPLQAYKITDNNEFSCYATRKILNDIVPIFDGQNATSDALQGYPLLETPLDYRFAEGFYFLVPQTAISQDAYGYFEELNQILARKGTFFDPPVGPIRTNIYNPDDPKAQNYGFFYVAQTDTARLYIPPTAVGNPSRYCPLPPVFPPPEIPPPPTSCDDCIIEAGADREKPWWW